MNSNRFIMEYIDALGSLILRIGVLMNETQISLHVCCRSTREITKQGSKSGVGVYPD